MKVILCWIFTISAALAFSSCGNEGDDPGLAVYAGDFSLQESWARDEGNQCSDPPTQVYENTVDIRIDKNQIEFRFDSRWATMNGTIHEGGAFDATLPGGLPDERFDLVGGYTDEDNFTAVMKDRREGCTRHWDMVGERIVTTQ